MRWRAGVPPEQPVAPVTKVHSKAAVLAPGACSAVESVPEDPSYQPRTPKLVSSKGSAKSTEPASGRTITACAHAITDLRKHKLAAFLEPLGVKHEGYVPAKDAETIARNCGIASALGDSSAHLWLKVPYCDDLQRVCRATTLPLLLLGGPARETAQETLRDFATGLAAGSRIRGAIIGRNLLYPGGDPLPMCKALTALVHKNASLENALQLLEK